MSKKNFCPKCGNELEENAKFCNSCGDDLSSPVKVSSVAPIQSSVKKTQATTPGGVQYANLVPRLIALIIDGIIIGLISSPLSWVLLPYNILNPLNIAFSWLNNLIAYIIGFVYFWGLESYNRGQTLGKMAMKLRTVDATTLQVAEPGNNAINNLAKPSALLILDFIIGVLSNSGDKTKRIRLLQNLSGTVVISEKYA